MAASMALWARQNAVQNAQNQVDGVENTFSSWDNCMSKTYCKWPVIIAIIIASLILLSVVSCLVRCLCCGLDCCCGIFKCFNACCECCTPRRRGGNSRYKDEPAPFQPSPYTGYQPPPAAPAYVPVQQPAPQFASFETPTNRALNPEPIQQRRFNEDSLPAMPSWKDAQTKHVEMEEEEVEMDHLNHTAAQRAPMLANQGPRPTASRNASAPIPGQQTPGQGLYSDDGHDQETGDLGEPYAQQQVSGYGYHNQQTGTTGYDHVSPSAQQGYRSPPAMQGYSAPPPLQQQGYAPNPSAASGYSQQQIYGAQQAYGAQQERRYQQNMSPPPPSYHTTAAENDYYAGQQYNHQAASPTGGPGAGSLPSSLTLGGGQQQGHQYQAYAQPTRRPVNGSWTDV